jgi:hypothetical protein
LLKVDPAAGSATEMRRTGFAHVRTRCVRPSYRLGLVEPDQPVLLWFSGSDRDHPSGLYAAGLTTGTVADSADGPVLPVRLCPLAPVVPRGAFLADPVLRTAEVVRMPAGSNPSYLDRRQYDALLAAHPQVDRGER